MSKRVVCLFWVCLSTWTASARADIFRWDNGILIPGTQGVTAGPGAQLDHRQLEYARLSELDLTGARFDLSNLANASFGGSTLTNANLTGANLTNANLRAVSLTSANLTGAVVTGANFYGTTSRGFTSSQLYSTKSYQDKNLRGIGIGSLGGFSQGLTNDLTGWDLHEQDLTNAYFAGSTLMNTNFTAAVVTGVDFRNTTSYGFTSSQLYSTKSYQDKNLRGIGLGSFGDELTNDLTGWDFHQQNLVNAIFRQATLTNANLTGAVVTGADFHDTTSHGFTTSQLYSTKSYQDKNLTGIILGINNLSGWDFHDQNLTNANLSVSTLTNANFTEAVVTGTNFGDTTSRGFASSQLYSTKSYQDKNLTGTGLSDNDLTGWDFHEQNLANADFVGSTLTNANLTGADTRGAQLGFLGGANALAGANSRNTISPDGHVAGLNLTAGDTLIIRDDDGVAPHPPQFWLSPRDPIPVTIQNQMTMSDGGTLDLLFDADPWDSLVLFQPAILVQLGGTLKLNFAPDIDLSSQIGRTLHLFDWTGVSPTGQFHVVSPYAWELSKLYSTGEVTLLGVPEPSNVTLAFAGLVTWLFRLRRSSTDDVMAANRQPLLPKC